MLNSEIQLQELNQKKIALAHEFLLYWGGGEKVFQEIARYFPEAPIYTLLYQKKIIQKMGWQRRKIIASFLNKIAVLIPHRWLLPFYSLAIEAVDLRDFDLVISSTSSFMKGLVVKPKTIHICYCHTPTRYLWDMSEKYLQENFKNSPFWPQKKFLSRIVLNYLRMWDQTSARRVDYFIANSKFTAQRIKKYYRRSSKVVYPPVKTKKFFIQPQKGKYFLVVSRLSAYKKIDLVIEAFNRLKWPLLIAGTGQERRKLQALAGPNIRFLGFVREEKLPQLYAGSRALIFAGEDDFGITMVESMASGRPVLAFRSGGALEIIEEGQTGEFFSAQEVEILVDGLRRLVDNENSYSPKYIKQSAERFSSDNFKRNFIETVSKMVKS